ncbi:energy transducer TonB [uncultured Tenacibaculum sp.]|uniref:energy transducer TonB n=1 Tax=uncultured Tenacibaculum sp. TaxID=174713 RepID=UPI00261C9217|nr:energy transducer TonB [uncultured Tenacibaculum sp.]
MILKRILILSFSILSSIIATSQNEVCTSPDSGDDLLMELNSISKCHVEEKKEEIAPKRNRYLRIRNNRYYANLRKNIRDLKTKKEPVKEVKAKEIYLGEATLEPVLLSANQNRGDFTETLESYVSDNLVYPESLKDNNVEGIVWSSFVIDTKGEVKNIVTLGPIGGKLLEQEAERLLKALPKFSPGELDGEKVNVKHLMAIKFELNI